MDLNRLRKLAGIMITESKSNDDLQYFLARANERGFVFVGSDKQLQDLRDDIDELAVEYSDEDYYIADLVADLFNSVDLEQIGFKYDPFVARFGRNPDKDFVIQTLLRLLKTGNFYEVANFITYAKKNGFNPPEFAVIEKSLKGSNIE